MAGAFSGRIIDYNGAGKWSAESVIQRYAEYCHRLGVEPKSHLIPEIHDEAGIRRIFPIMTQVIAGVERGDDACIAIAVDFIEEDQKAPFWRKLKSNAARALHRANLSAQQTARVRSRYALLQLPAPALPE